MSNENLEEKLVPEIRFKQYSEFWQKTKLSEICNIQDGTHATPTYVEAGVPFFSVDTIINNVPPKFISNEEHEKLIKRCNPKKGDILISRITGGILGYSKLVDWDYEFSIYVSLALLSSIKINPRYLNQYLKTQYYRKDFLSKSLLIAVPPKINLNDLAKTEIKYPSLEEQEKIAKFLELIDKKIELLEKKSQLINIEKEYYLNLFFNENTEFNLKSDLKKIKLENILSLQGGFNFDSKSFDDTANNKVIKIGDIPNNLNLEKFNGNYSKQNSGEKYEVKSGDILIALSGATFGKSGKVSGNGFAFINQRVAKFNCEQCDSNYIFQLINSSKFKKYLNMLPTSSAQPNISNKDILNYSTFIPEINEQRKIGNLFNKIDNQIELIDKQIYNIKKFKKGLLQKMFV